MRETLMLFVIIFCWPLAAMAEDFPKAEIFGGFSIYSGSLAIGDYNKLASRLGTDDVDIPPGWDLEGNVLRRENREQFYGYQINVAGNFHENFGIAADFGYQFNEFNEQSFGVYQYLFGPRFNMRGDKTTVFAQALFGGNGFRPGESGQLFDFSNHRHYSERAFAMGIGGGVDVNAGKRFAIRVIQFDWIPNRMSGDWSTGEFRLGFGVVFKAGI